MKPSEGRSKVKPKLIRRQAEWRYASLSEPMLSAEKLFDVAPVSW
ncbi:portal protein [Listeria monocytogenes]